MPPTIGNASRLCEWLPLTRGNASHPCEWLPLRGGMGSRLCEWLPLTWSNASPLCDWLPLIWGNASRLCDGLPLCSDCLASKFSFLAIETILLIYTIFTNFGFAKTTYLTTNFPVAFWVALLSVYT